MVKFFLYSSIATEQQTQQNEVGAGDSRVDNTLKAGTESQETLPPEVVNVSRHLTHKAPPIICSRGQFQILPLFQK